MEFVHKTPGVSLDNNNTIKNVDNIDQDLRIVSDDWFETIPIKFNDSSQQNEINIPKGKFNHKPKGKIFKKKNKKH